jgi:hypothetical protein
MEFFWEYLAIPMVAAVGVIILFRSIKGRSAK